MWNGQDQPGTTTPVGPDLAGPEKKDLCNAFFAGTGNEENGKVDSNSVAFKNLQDAEAVKKGLLKCGSAEADPGCLVTVRYIAQVSRGSKLHQVFAQMVTGFALANDPNSNVVGLNLVQPEDSLSSMTNFSVQMQMLQYLRPLYPRAHVSLHAGELAPGVVPPDGLTFHIRDSVMTARAERIGHGVDLMHEREPFELLKEMAQRNVMVEICLSSNDLILGVAGAQHPLATYMQYGVPVALATDDEGVSRIDLTHEYGRAVQTYNLSYRDLKQIVRTSLEHSFLPGDSLWRAPDVFTAAASACSKDSLGSDKPSSACSSFLRSSEKASQQWELERRFHQFESAL